MEELHRELARLTTHAGHWGPARWAMPATGGNGAPSQAVQNAFGSVAQSLPADLASLAGLASGTKRLGSTLTN